MKSILVTGGNGLLARGFLKLVPNIYNAYATVHHEPIEAIAGVQYVDIDFSKSWSNYRLPRDIDIIVHLAQSSRYSEFPRSADDIFKVNVESTAKLLDFAVNCGVKKFIYASTGGLYSNVDVNRSEDDHLLSLDELSFYYASKLSGEALVRAYSKFVDTVIVRPFFIYGHGQRRSMLLPRLFDMVRNQSPVLLNGSSGLIFNPIHVEDAAKALLCMLERNVADTYNIAGPDVVSIRELCEKIGDHLGVSPIFQNNSGGVSNLVADISRMENDLISPSLSVLQHIRELDY